MKSWRRAHWFALFGGLAAFATVLILLKLRSFMPVAVGLLAYLSLLILLRPRLRAEAAPLPEGVTQEDFDLAMERMSIGARRLRRELPRAPSADRRIIGQMADLIDRIREHHQDNPGHVTLTRRFIRQSLGRMVQAVIDYVALAERAGGAQKARLEEISAEIHAFVPALEGIDRACLQNDLDALQVSVEVLNHQMDRHRR